MKLFDKKTQDSSKTDRTQRTISIIRKLQQNNLGDKTRLENMLIDLEEGLPLDADAKTYLKSLYEQYKAQRRTHTASPPAQIRQDSSTEPRKSEESKIEVLEIIQYAKKLRAMNIGESWRLDYVINTLERGDPLFSSDMEYIQSMIARHFNVGTDNAIHQQTQHIRYVQPQTGKKDAVKKKIPDIKSVLTWHAPPKFIDGALLTTRLGLAFIFIWAGMGKIANPISTLDMIDDLGLNLTASADTVTMFGMLEIIAAVMVLTGAATRIGAAMHLGILVWAQSIFGFSYVVGPSLWKDVAIIGAAILLIICGSGKFGIDGILKSNKTVKSKESISPEINHNVYHESTDVSQRHQNIDNQNTSKFGFFAKRTSKYGNSQIKDDKFFVKQNLEKERVDSEKILFSNTQSRPANSPAHEYKSSEYNYNVLDKEHTYNNVECDRITDTIEMSSLIKEIKQEKTDMHRTSRYESTKDSSLRPAIRDTSESIQARLDAKILEIKRLKDSLNAILDDLMVIKKEL